WSDEPVPDEDNTTDQELVENTTRSHDSDVFMEETLTNAANQPSPIQVPTPSFSQRLPRLRPPTKPDATKVPT
ncbi:hypothetical protein BGZ94_005362, partial [Podila epigama]